MLVPLPRFLDPPKRQWGLIAVLVVVYLVTDRPDHALHDKARVFALAFVIVFVFVPTLVWLARRDGLPTRAMAGALAALAVAAIGARLSGRAPLPQPPLRQRSAPQPRSPGWAWTRPTPGPAACTTRASAWSGTTAGLRRLRLLRPRPLQPRPLPRRKGPPRRLQRDPDLRKPSATAVNDADLDYLVTSPFLNFLHSEQAGRLARGPLAARLRRRPPALPRRRSHRLESDRPAEADLRPGERPAPRSPKHARNLNASGPKTGYSGFRPINRGRRGRGRWRCRRPPRRR